MGEIDLLQRILKDKTYKPRIIHYLAVDMSPILLKAHLTKLKKTFGKELNEKRLICIAAIGNIFELKTTVEAARKYIGKRKKATGNFLPNNVPILISYLGNCLGNDDPEREWSIFSSVIKAFPRNPLCFLVGISVMQKRPDRYGATRFQFLLNTPRYLMENLGLIQTMAQKV